MPPIDFDDYPPPHDLVVDITDDDILLGVRYNCRLCPAARACERMYGEDFVYEVQDAMIAIYQHPSKILRLPKKPVVYYDMSLPDWMRLVVYDEGGALAPFSFKAERWMTKPPRRGNV